MSEQHQHPAQDPMDSERRRALTGRDPACKSVFSSFDVTPQVIHIHANPGPTFYELYATEGVPRLAGTKSDPMLRKTQVFPGAGRHQLPADHLSRPNPGTEPCLMAFVSVGGKRSEGQ